MNAHSVCVAGHAIVFATLVNAGGFLALILSSLPPMHHFEIVTSAAFTLALLADFTALPTALWLFFRDRPDADIERWRGDHPGGPTVSRPISSGTASVSTSSHARRAQHRKAIACH